MRLFIFITLLLLVNTHVSGQGDYRACDKLAVQALRLCLHDHQNDDNQHCWTSSHQAYNECTLGLAKQPLEPRQLDKAELRALAKLDKNISANKIRVRLMAAATVGVYKQVLNKALKQMAQRMSHPHTKSVDQKGLKQRIKAYRQYLVYVQSSLSCEAMGEKLTANNQPGTGDEKRLRRELVKLLPSYCRLE